MPGGSTRLAAVIGDPIQHSLSPLIHNTGFRTLGIDWVFVALRVERGNGAKAIDAARSLGIEGLSVTMPLKSEVIAALDQISPIAQRLSSVNVVFRRGNGLIGDNTDGQGFINALRAEDLDLQSKHCVVVGAGGAAKAVVLALGESGAASVSVVARRHDEAVSTAELAGSAGRVGVLEEISDSDLVVNATPVGMGVTHGNVDSEDLPFDPSLVSSGQFVCDLIYYPLATPLLIAAERNGARVVNGLGMLIHQAALSFSLWTGEQAPVDAISTAVREAFTTY